MNILAIDTAGPVLSAALAAPGGTKYAEVEAGTRHSELLLEIVDGLFKSAGLRSGDLELAACMKGPGSFTGLRIAYAAAKGLSLALGIPLAAVPTLDCMARGAASRPGLALPVIDAKKSRFYAALFRRENRVSPYLDAETETLIRMIKERRQNQNGQNEKITLTGPGAEMLFPLLSKEIENLEIEPLPGRGRAMELLEIIKTNGILSYAEEENCGPLYLRKSDAELTVKP